VTVPEERFSLTVPEERFSMTVPEERFSMTVPEERPEGASRRAAEAASDHSIRKVRFSSRWLVSASTHGP
jgi:hypothetical protein